VQQPLRRSAPQLLQPARPARSAAVQATAMSAPAAQASKSVSGTMQQLREQGK